MHYTSQGTVPLLHIADIKLCNNGVDEYEDDVTSTCELVKQASATLLQQL